MPAGDSEEVERLARAFRVELRPEGEAGEVLVRRAAVLAVRMDRAAIQEAAATSARVRQAVEEFEAPEGVDPEMAARLRVEAGQVALFDPSEEASQARQYEASAQRGFFRALDELRRLKREAKAEEATTVAQAVGEVSREALGSFSRIEKELAAAPARALQAAPPSFPKVAAASILDDLATLDRRFDVPMAIGRRS